MLRLWMKWKNYVFVLQTTLSWRIQWEKHKTAIDAMRNEKQEHYIFNLQRYWERPEWSNLIKLDNDKWNNQKLIKHFEIETRSEELLFLSL